MTDSAALIAHLRRVAAAGMLPHAAESADDWLVKGFARGQLHEVYATDGGEVAAAAGFAITQALAARATPLVLLRPEAGEKLAGRLHATGLLELGLPPDDLLLVLVADAGALLRAAADIARCAGVGTLVMESWGPMPALDLTATRRLVLAAEASGVTVISLRCQAEPVPSAAATRWRVAARPSTPLEADAPGGPTFDIECLRRRGGPSGTRWRVEWNRETRCFDLQDGAAMAGARLPVAAGGAAAVDPPAPVRARG